MNVQYMHAHSLLRILYFDACQYAIIRVRVQNLLARTAEHWFYFLFLNSTLLFDSCIAFRCSINQCSISIFRIDRKIQQRAARLCVNSCSPLSNGQRFSPSRRPKNFVRGSGTRTRASTRAKYPRPASGARLRKALVDVHRGARAAPRGLLRGHLLVRRVHPVAWLLIALVAVLVVIRTGRLLAAHVQEKGPGGRKPADADLHIHNRYILYYLLLVCCTV